MTKLLTMEDLARRWNLAAADEKCAVLDQALPFVQFGRSLKRIRWGLLRFRPEAVVLWEQSREVQQAARPAAPRAVAVAPQPPEKDWREWMTPYRAGARERPKPDASSKGKGKPE